MRSKSNLPTIDRGIIESLRELGDGDDDLLHELIELFLCDAPRLLAGIQAAIATDDANALEHASHSLKSSSANMGAKRLADLCMEVERTARTGTTAGTEGIAKEIGLELEAVDEALRVL